MPSSGKSKKNKKKPDYQAPALEKGLDILEILTRSPEPLSQRGVADRMGKSVNEIFRMLACLDKRGFIFRDSITGNYSPTLKLYEMGCAHPLVERLKSASARPLRGLSQEVGESCHISILEGGRVLVVAHQESPNPLSLHVRTGVFVPLKNSLAGRLLLAQMNNENRQTMLEKDDDFQGLDDEAKAEFIAELDSMKGESAFIAPSTQVTGVTDVSVIIKGAGAGLYAAVSLPCLKKWNKKELKKQVIPAAQKASKKIEESCGI